MRRPFLPWLYGGIKGRVPFAPPKRMARLVAGIQPQTRQHHAAIAAEAQVWADANGHSEDPDPMLRSLAHRFQGSRSTEERWRFLLHVPPPEIAIAARSIMLNLADALRFLGVETRLLGWEGDLASALNETSPTIFLTGSHELFLSNIDWGSLGDFKAQRGLIVGIHSPPREETTGKLRELLRTAQELGVDLFYDYAAPEYVGYRPELIANSRFPIVSFEHGANPFVYRPLVGIDRDLDYVFLGSVHGLKLSRYLDLFSPILRRYPGFLLGPGWQTGPPEFLPKETHAFLYARAKVGINVHLRKQLKGPMQLNERFYNLASAGVPQLVDPAVLVGTRFPPPALFVAGSRRAYLDAFEQILSDPLEAARRAGVARAIVLDRHTVVHTAASMLHQLDSVFA